MAGTGTRAPVSNRSVVKNLTSDRAELNADDSVFPNIDAGTIGYVVVIEEGATDHPVAYLSSDGAGASFALATNGANVTVSWPGGRVSRIE